MIIIDSILFNVGHTSAGWMCVSLLSTLCSALSKEQGITAVAVCLAYDVLYCVKVRYYCWIHQSVKALLHGMKAKNSMYKLFTDIIRTYNIIIFIISRLMLHHYSN